MTEQSMNRELDAITGMEMVRKALLALAENDEAAALAALNGGTHGETTWAAATLLFQLRECISGRVNAKPVRLALALRATADGMDEDILITRVQVGLKEAFPDL